MKQCQPKRFTVRELGAPAQPQENCPNRFDRQCDDEDVEGEIGGAAKTSPLPAERDEPLAAKRLLDHEAFIEGDPAPDQTEKEHAERDKSNTSDLKKE